MSMLILDSILLLGGELVDVLEVVRVLSEQSALSEDRDLCLKALLLGEPESSEFQNKQRSAPHPATSNMRGARAHLSTSASICSLLIPSSGFLIFADTASFEREGDERSRCSISVLGSFLSRFMVIVCGRLVEQGRKGAREVSEGRTRRGSGQN